MEQIKKGYKKSEVGVIPEDWAVKRFYEVTNAITCGVAATPEYVSEQNGMPFLSASHVQNEKVINTNFKFIKKELYNQITKINKPEKGDILYTRVGAGIGQAGIIDFDLDFGIYVSLTLIKPKKNLNSYFIKSLLNSKFYNFLAKNGQFAGGGVQNLNVEVVRQFPIPIPTLAEQKAIADALSDVDELIANLEKLIAKKKAIKQGAMQQLLTPPQKGGKRLEGFSGEWIEMKLGDLCRISKGQLITESSRISGEIPVIAGGKTPAYYHNKANRLGKTITISASGASAGYVSFHKIPIFASDCSTIEEGNDYVIEFIFFFLQCIQSRIYKMQTGGAQPHIHPSDLNPILLYVPSISEQSTIANILSEMEFEIQSLEKRLSKANQLKQGMMQELLTGKTRII